MSETIQTVGAALAILWTVGVVVVGLVNLVLRPPRRRKTDDDIPLGTPAVGHKGGLIIYPESTDDMPRRGHDDGDR